MDLTWPLEILRNAEENNGHLNQKQWVERTIRAAVNQRTAAYNTGNMSEYKASCYALRRAVRAAKLRYS